ncbi:MAG TPA: DUF4198 domain-containing protein [Rhodobacteraceae bacterium]|nr:DUF4198 domain-containing protein [Paracoccaceae bacterium]
MKNIFRPIALILFAMSFAGIALPVLGHEFWLEPQKFQPETGATVQVKLRNGMKFSGIELGYFDDRTVVFDIIQNGTRTPVQARAGDFPAFSKSALTDGLIVLIYQSKFSKLQYNKFEKFAAFVEHKSFDGVVERHKERGLPMERFNEVYTRFCKTLIGVGAGAGQDAATGMETEFIALTNPYTDDLSDGFTVQVLYQGAPRVDAQVEVFERAPDNTVTVTYHRTDDQGHATVPVKPGHTYLFDAVVLREPAQTLADETNAVWESLWASLTFATPN